MIFKNITPENTCQLRKKYLRPNLSVEECRLPGDYDPHSAHFGVFYVDQIVGVISVFRDNLVIEDLILDWRIRGLAVTEKFRGLGLGTNLINEVTRYAKTENGKGIWCNARPRAINIYNRAGFKTFGDVFDIKGLGPHNKMYLIL